LFQESPLERELQIRVILVFVVNQAQKKNVTLVKIKRKKNKMVEASR